MNRVLNKLGGGGLLCFRKEQKLLLVLDFYWKMRMRRRTVSSEFYEQLFQTHLQKVSHGLILTTSA